MSSILASVQPPVPDPDLPPKPADQMADEGDREGPVLKDGSRPEEAGDVEADPQFATNGD